jgi:hypothetical protein
MRMSKITAVFLLTIYFQNHILNTHHRATDLNILIVTPLCKSEYLQVKNANIMKFQGIMWK